MNREQMLSLAVTAGFPRKDRSWVDAPRDGGENHEALTDALVSFANLILFSMRPTPVEEQTAFEQAARKLYEGNKKNPDLFARGYGGCKYEARHIDNAYAGWMLRAELAANTQALSPVAPASQHPSDWNAAIEALRCAAPLAEDSKDAERYRWLRDRRNSLETRQRDKGILNGVSCYHDVEGIHELKHGDGLDAAIDAAIAQQSDAGVQK